MLAGTGIVLIVGLGALDNLIKLDLPFHQPHNRSAMQRVLQPEPIRAALAAKGWDQKQLAQTIGVSAQAVTNWMKGDDFPRPATLLKLATALSLSFDKLVHLPQRDEPIIAFRKKAGTKTTDEHVLRAKAMGALLKPLVPFLPPRKALRTQIPSASTEYELLQNAAASVRAKLGIGAESVLTYERLIAEFDANDAVLIPVMWGKKDRHENALHILLPGDQVTFIYLNLDTHLEDFKFWMAHELAHVYTPDLAGKDAGEDFADAFAGSLLFPRELARHAYAEARRAPTAGAEMQVLQQFAHQHLISLFTVYTQVSRHATAAGLRPLRVADKSIHAVRNSGRGELVSQALFEPMPPDPSTYIAAAHNVFQSAFFPALRRMLHERGTGVGYVQQLLDASIADAQALHTELIR